MKAEDKASVLFVCMGNICRSPLAEGVFREVVRMTAGFDVLVDSAGTHSYHVGQPPDDRAIAAARQRGVDIASLRARAVCQADFDRFDLIVAMDRDNRTLLTQQFRSGTAGLRLFMQYAGDSEGDVPDPYYGGLEGFEHALDLVERGAQALLAELRQLPRLR